MEGSLFAEALETDPEATEISLENPVVEPKHLGLLVRMSRQEEIKVELLEDFDPETTFYSLEAYNAAIYLNWPLLQVIDSGLLNEIQAFAPYANIYKPETYGPLLLWSLARDDSSLTRHILQVTEPGPLDAQAFLVATLHGRLAAVKALLAREVNPATAYTPLHLLKIWCPQLTRPNPHPETDPLVESKQNQALCLVISAYLNFPENLGKIVPVIQLLLQDTRCHSALQNILEVACQIPSSALVEMLLTLTPVDPNIIRQPPVIVYALEQPYLPLAKVLAACPRLKLSDALRQYILSLENFPYDREEYEQVIRRVRDDVIQN
jgi:hypothetical protein